MSTIIMLIIVIVCAMFSKKGNSYEDKAFDKYPGFHQENERQRYIARLKRRDRNRY
ncbi:MAG: hypothetical protein HUK09_08905 [Bacteroidaceae bacterium]|nr:hypothetical protein [Bacteroidaceae bacterium]